MRPANFPIRDVLGDSSADAGRLTPADRNRYLITVFSGIFVLATARFLEPSPAGVGTHQQLGLPQCPFLHLTGFPCPSCGLTTSFALAARLNFQTAFTTQPFGLLAFFLVLLSIPLALFLIYRRIPTSVPAAILQSNRLMYLLIAFYLLGWIYKIVAMKFTGP